MRRMKRGQGIHVVRTRQADDLCPGFGRLLDRCAGRLDVGGLVVAHQDLTQAQFNLVSGGRAITG